MTTERKEVSLSRAKSEKKVYRRARNLQKTEKNTLLTNVTIADSMHKSFMGGINILKLVCTSLKD